MAVSEKAPAIHEKQTPSIDIPKSREIFSGDINEAVITVQKITGFEISPDWWSTNVGNEGSTESILERFDTAFEGLLHEQMGATTPEKSQVGSEEKIVTEADSELQAFDKLTLDDPSLAAVEDEFLADFKMHLVEKYCTEEESDKWRFEKNKLDEVFGKFPANERNIEFEHNGVAVIACGRELKVGETAVIRDALTKVESTIGRTQFEELFAGVKLYVGDNLIEGGGLALPRFEAVVVDLEKIGVTVTQMEEMLDDGSDNPDYKKGDQSKLVENPDTDESSELGIVHEFGHILEYRAHGGVDRGFANLDQVVSPTHYGSKSAREDYAESFMYYVYDGDISADRRRIIEADTKKHSVSY